MDILLGQRCGERRKLSITFDGDALISLFMGIVTYKVLELMHVTNVLCHVISIAFEIIEVMVLEQ